MRSRPTWAPNRPTFPAHFGPLERTAEKNAAVSFRPGDLAQKFDERAFEGEPSRGEIVRRDLERYYYAIDLALSDIAKTLSAAEAIERFWTDCQNSTVQSVGLTKDDPVKSN